MKRVLIGLSGVALLMTVGCSTNRLGDPKKEEYIKKLATTGDNLMEQIDRAQAEKAELERQMKAQLLDLQERLKDQFGKKNLYLTQSSEGLQVTILDNILFRSGSDNINNKGQQVLQELAQALKKTDKEIQITGHTDNVPVQKSKHKFKDNWDLSIKRALSVLHVLENSGVAAQKMCAVGYGQYRPMESNESVKGRSQNRRVDILILDRPIPRVKPGSEPKKNVPAAVATDGAKAKTNAYIK